MAAETVTVALATSAYTALSSGETDVTVAVKRGQAIRIHFGSSLPAADVAAYIPFEGPTSSDDSTAPASFTGITGNVYARAERKAETVVVMRQ